MIETWFNQDVKQAVQVQYLDGNVFSMDNNGNRVGVCLYDGETEVNVAGTISGEVIRVDGGTVAIEGSSSGNQAWVDLPQAACAVPGLISVVIKETSGENITTICAVVANVYMTSTDTAVDPGTIIPDISTLVAEIEAAVASIPADYSSLWASVAPVFNSSNYYDKGRYVTYNGKTYKFTSPHSPGSWSANDTEQVSVGTEAWKTNNALKDNSDKNIIDDLTLSSGYIDASGVERSDDVARKSSLFFMPAGYYAIDCFRYDAAQYTYNIRIHEYTSGGTFVDQRVYFKVTAPGRFKNIFHVPKDIYARISIGAYTYGTNGIYYIGNREGFSSDSLARTIADSNPNLIDLETVRKGYILNSSGYQVTEPFGWISDMISVKPGRKYTVSGSRLYTTISANTIKVAGYRKDRQLITNPVLATITFPQDSSSDGNLMPQQSVTFTIPDDCYYVVVSNGWYDMISCKLEYGETATGNYKSDYCAPNEKQQELFDMSNKNTRGVVDVFRGTIDIETGSVTQDSSVTNEVYTFLDIIQDGEKAYVQILPYSTKYVYDIYFYNPKTYAYISRLNTVYVDANHLSYMDGAKLFRISIKAKGNEEITNDDLAAIKNGIKIVTYKNPSIDKRPKYTLIGSPGIYKSPAVDYLVTSSMTANYIYGLYDALVTEYPNNITKEQIGTAFSLPIYCYTFQPTIPKTWHHYGEQWNPTTWGDDPKMPMILIVAGTHGDEKGTVYGLANYMAQMWNAETTPETDFLRDNAIIKVVPILNVSGFADNTRNNRNNVNLNRDFGTFSQVESQTIRTLYNTYKDYIRVMIDYHQTPTRPALWGDPTDDLMKNIMRIISMPLGVYWEQQKPELVSYSPRLEFWNFDSSGAQSAWFSAMGVISTTCESAWNLTGMKGTPVWGTNDLFTEKCGIDLLGNVAIAMLRSAPQMEESYFDRLEMVQIITQPEDETVASGAIAEFSVGAVGYTLSYQWQYCADDSRNFSNVTFGYVYPDEENPYPGWGAAANSNIWPTLRVQASNSNNGYTYRCEVKDLFGNRVYSKEVKLTVT